MPGGGPASGTDTSTLVAIIEVRPPCLPTPRAILRWPTMVTGEGRPGRILHVVASTDRRGAETAAVDLAGALEGLGQSGVVVALAPGDAGGLDIPVLGPARFSAHGLAGLRRHARRSAGVVAHGSSTLPAVAAVTLGTGVPFVYRSIGDPRAWVTTAARRTRVRAAAAR